MAAWDIQGRDALSTTSGLTGGGSFDNSGWNVNFGEGSIRSDRTQATPEAAVALAATNYVPYALAAVGVLVLWKLTRKRKP